jgi:hypothetical protein
VNHFTVTVKKKSIRFAMGRSDLFIGRHGCGLPTHEETKKNGNESPNDHGSTSNSALGISPIISGK